MSSPAVLPSLLTSLPPRPPTPPRETHHEAAATTSRHPLGPVDSRLNLHTPPGHQSPASSVAADSTSRRIRKKVGFSAQAEYKDPPVYCEGGAVQQQPTPVSLPPSRSKPVKSILKVTNHVPSFFDSSAGAICNPPNPHANLAAMLESTIQQLAGGDRDSKVDAYLMLTRAWKASNNLPDRVALQEKMGLFTQFMQRDVAARTPEGALDTSLVNHALNLLNTFLHFPAIASTITNDFGVFIIDHCIRSFEDASTPKDTARRLMQVISLQNFSSKVMTIDRVGRLVSSLHNIEEHLKGKSIVLSRVLIYRKLVQQSRQLMIIHSDWLLDMFTDMLSSLRDIRSAAISLGLEAAFSIGHEKQLSRKVMEVLNLSYENRRYIQYYEEKLQAMAKDKHESAVVPQIWSVVILLLRIPLDKWENAGPWLRIIQDCFNSTDFPTKIAANHAWCRLVYLMLLEERTSGKNLSTLTTPLISQLRRKGTGKPSEDLRQTVLGGICNLFYYAFKPTINPGILDAHWDNSVRPVLNKLLEPKAEAAEDNLRQATAILTGLFDSTTPRRWRADHITESTLVKPEELPPIDPKWIRRNTNRVFAVVQPILEQDFLALARTDSASYTLWKALVSTVASAAAKEVKVSRDTAVFVVEALNVLQKIWKLGPAGGERGQSRVVDFLLAVRAYLEVMISSLGRLPFTEKPGRHQALAKAPLYALFAMLSTLPPGVPDDKDFAEFFSSIFAPFCASKADKARMELAQDLLSAIPMDAPRPYGPWLLVAENILAWLEPSHCSHHSTGSGNETPVGHDYRDIVKVLERGIRSIPNLPPKHWGSLFYALVGRVRDETGDAGVAIVVIEPLAKTLIEQFTPRDSVDVPLSCVRYATELVSVATQPRDRQAVDAARKRLWGTALAGSRSSSFDTFDGLYKAVNEALGYAYDKFDLVDSDLVVHLLKELGGFFDRCNPQLFVRALTASQDGILPWFQDNKRQLNSQASPVLTAVKSLWEKLCRRVAEMERPEQQLQVLERFFCASFASCHRSIVNSSISLWNRLFENIEQLEYPEQLKVALVQMQLHADIAVPGLDTSSAEYAGQQPMFMDSLDDLSSPALTSTRSSSRGGTPQAAGSYRSNMPAPIKPTMPDTRPLQASSSPRTTRDTRRGTPPRPRHDDSQVQFAEIEHLPALGVAIESQILTERQKEVRERQRENAALFPEIRSSPAVKSKETSRSKLSVGSRPRQATTPEPESTFDDYVSSTPTPRRGQPMVMTEHDMTDPPSSPPEPRGNPLAAEIKSRSASQSLLEEWQFSSSPVSGSPNPNRQGVVSDASSKRGDVSVVSLPEAEDIGQSTGNAASGGNREAPGMATDEVIEDSMVLDRPGTAQAMQSLKPPVGENPSTPRRSPRLSKSKARQTPTPRSDGEEFVDAPTSPLPPTPKPSGRATKATSAPEAKQTDVTTADDTFDISDVDEKSLLRLVVELDTGKIDRSEYDRSSASPGGKRQDSSPCLDCIVVGDSPKKAARASPRKNKASSATPATVSAAEPDKTPGTPSTPRGTRPKRKRASSRAHETGGQKRQRHEPNKETGEVLSSQSALVQGAAPPAEARETREERMPSSSAECSASASAGEDGISQDATPPETSNAMEVEGKEHEVLSRVEPGSFEQNQPLEQQGNTEEPMQLDVQQATTDAEKEDGDKAAKTAAEPAVDNDATKTATPALTQAQRILDLFRNGLAELRTARLSRQEVYEIEDMFMDVKRELYEAERRGRT